MSKPLPYKIALSPSSHGSSLGHEGNLFSQIAFTSHQLGGKLLITEEKFCSYYFALKNVYILHKKYGFGKSPDIPSGFSESLGRHILNLSHGSDRTHDAIDSDGNQLEIKATGSAEGKTTISNSNKFEILVWAYIEFDTDSVHIYRLPRKFFSLNGGTGRNSISLRSIATQNNITPEIFLFEFQTISQGIENV